jgi:hypothetical protein
MNNLKNPGNVVCAAVCGLLLSLTGCVSVPIRSVRMPTIDTSNVERLAVRPFENRSAGVRAGAQAAQYLTETTARRIAATGKFIIVSPADPNADGIFSGEIRSIASNDSQERKEVKDSNGNIIIQITYIREVSLEFSYSVLSSRTGMPIGGVVIIKQGSYTDSNVDASRISDTLTLAKRIIDSQLRSLEQDIVPTIVTTSRRLMDETSKDKVVKERMKAALALVKDGYYAEAIGEYDEIADRYGSVAARTNAAILRESISSDAAARATMNQLDSARIGLSDRAVREAVGVLNSRLPQGANIAIIKTSYAERQLLDYVVDQITGTVVREGRLKVVDRTNRALITAEQQFQMSGYVSDDSAVSIANQLGVKYMVLCWISGERSGRLLNIRILNVETAQIAYQTSFEI